MNGSNQSCLHCHKKIFLFSVFLILVGAEGIASNHVMVLILGHFILLLAHGKTVMLWKDYMHLSLLQQGFTSKGTVQQGEISSPQVLGRV